MHEPFVGLRKLHFLFFILIVSPSWAQESPRDVNELYEELDSLFADDRLPGNLFLLADSILALENAKISALNVRAGYVSEIQTAGRAFGLNQHGLTGAINYFHHSGFNAGVTGYANSYYSPAYYMTDLYLGYMYTYKEKLTLQFNHDFYIYNDSLLTYPFNKSAQVSVNYQVRYADAGVDYAYLYGNREANRINFHLNGRIKFRFKKGIDAITIMPGCALQWGNADISYLRQPHAALTDLYKIINENKYPHLERKEYLRLMSLLEKNQGSAAIAFLRKRDYTSNQIASLFDAYYDGAVVTQNSFGFMNWNLSVPVLIRKSKFTLLLNYTYNMPQALPGETATYPASGYFSTSLSYMLSWLKK
jgi:hypothetical protein